MNWKTPQKILIVDDAAVNRQVLGDLFRAEHTVILAKSGEQALDRAAQHQPDVILLDVVMPEMDGYEVLKRLRADARTSAIAVIFITGLDTPEDEAYGLTVGASDYITKPFNIQVVKARVNVHLRLARQQRLLETLANVDGLTEIPNRRYFDERFADEFERAEREGRPLSLGLCDIDFFKQYNDRVGHAGGDRMLRDVARTLVSVCRPDDFVARYGGEEFALLMPDTTAEEAREVADEVRQAIAALLTESDGEVSSGVTISIGGATLEPGLYESLDDLLTAADDELYKCKDAGRDRVRWRGLDVMASGGVTSLGFGETVAE